MSEAENIPRGHALRPKVSARMLHAVREQYGIAGNVVRDLGGSSNLNLLMEAAGHRYVARVHRTWVTSSRLADVQAVRRELARGGVPQPSSLPHPQPVARTHALVGPDTMKVKEPADDCR